MAKDAQVTGAPRNPAGNKPMGTQTPKPPQPNPSAGTHQSGQGPKHPFGNLPSTVAQPGIKPGRS